MEHGWKLDETIGAQIVQVPMWEAVRASDEAFRGFLVTLGGVFAFTLLALNVLFELVFIRPLKRLSSMADRVSRGDLAVEGVATSGNDEVAALSGSFDRMRISLVKAPDWLRDPPGNA